MEDYDLSCNDYSMANVENPVTRDLNKQIGSMIGLSGFQINYLMVVHLVVRYIVLFVEWVEQ